MNFNSDTMAPSTTEQKAPASDMPASHKSSKDQAIQEKSPEVRCGDIWIREPLLTKEQATWLSAVHAPRASARELVILPEEIPSEELPGRVAGMDERAEERAERNAPLPNESRLREIREKIQVGMDELTRIKELPKSGSGGSLPSSTEEDKGEVKTNVEN